MNRLAQLVADTLDELPITDRVFHHLSASAPLVTQILDRVERRHDVRERLLLIGGNALLGHALVRMGIDVDIWYFREGFLTDSLQDRVTRQITPGDLASGALNFDCQSPKFGTIVLPLVLESIAENPREVLAGVRQGLRPSGNLIVATSNLSRLEVRTAALSGKNFAPAAASPPQLSLSWPALGMVREYHRDDLVPACRDAGFKVRECSHVIAAKPFVALDSFGLSVYANHKLHQLVKSVVPSTRDVILLDLTPRPDDRFETPERFRRNVSVIVSASHGPTALARTLQSLEDQTYPRDRYEIIVLHNSNSPETVAMLHERQRASPCVVRDVHVAEPEGPLARNAAMAQALGDICAHTDDACEAPPDWIQGAVGWFDDRTAIVAGAIHAREGSVPRYMDPPGSRPDGDDKGTFLKWLFSISNVFYRRSTALEAGGFDEEFCASPNGHCLGWDTELAWRLRNQGWETRFREDVFVFREFHSPDRLRWVPLHWHQMQHLPTVVARVQPLEKELVTAGVFASSHTFFFDLLLAGLAAAVVRRRARYAAFGLPWLFAVGQRLDFWPPSQWRGSTRMLAARSLRHFTWLAGLLYGSLRARRLVL